MDKLVGHQCRLLRVREGDRHCFLPLLLVFVMQCVKMQCFCLITPIAARFLQLCACFTCSSTHVSTLHPLLAHHHLCYVDVYCVFFFNFIFAVFLRFFVFFLCACASFLLLLLLMFVFMYGPYMTLRHIFWRASRGCFILTRGENTCWQSWIVGMQSQM